MTGFQLNPGAEGESELIKFIIILNSISNRVAIRVSQGTDAIEVV